MLKTTSCVDCRVEFSYEHRTGPTRQRCEPCRTERKAIKNREKSQRWKDNNRERHVAYLREYHQARKDDPEYRRKRRENMVRYTYGITQAEVDALIESQGGRCAICGGERNGAGTRLHIDHCHDTGKVRGMLCSKCNTAVGLLDNDPDRAEKLAAYLRR
jgi:hypothetical protein